MSRCRRICLLLVHLALLAALAGCARPVHRRPVPAPLIDDVAVVGMPAHIRDWGDNPSPILQKSLADEMKSGTAVPHSKTWPSPQMQFVARVLECGGAPPLCFLGSRQFCDNWWTRFVPVCALLVCMRDLQNPRVVQGFA